MRNKDSVSFTMDQDGVRVELAILNLEESNKIIGTFLRHGRSNKAIKNYMLNKIEKWLELTKKGWWGRDKMQLALMNPIWKAAEYVFLCSNLSKDE